MKAIFRSFCIVLLGLGFSLPMRASMVLPVSLDEHLHLAEAVFRGTVLTTGSYKDTNGFIFTRTSLRVDEVFKGKFPAVVNVVQRGGAVDGIGMFDDGSPQFKTGQERLLFLSRRSTGLFATLGDASAVKLERQKDGVFSPAHLNLLNEVRAHAAASGIAGADVTDQAATPPPGGWISAPSGDNSGPSVNGLLVDGSGVPWRYLAPDRGEQIPYLVDDTSLPSGITTNQALGAVSNALAAWTAASSVRFVFIGTQNFGMASPNISTNDGIVRIQLHDNYNYITSPNVLGQGGSFFSTGLLPTANWGTGGNVAGTEFNQGECGFVVLKHTNSVMQTLSTFTEVLTHEIGHVMGLAHSSNVTTNDSILTNSIMYYLAHADGRGAKLNSYDTNVVRELHPFNTPPYAYNRMMDVITAPEQPNVPGINEVQLRGYDLQTTNLTLAVTNMSVNAGSFANVGNEFIYTPAAYYQDSDRNDPISEDGIHFSFIDIAYARFSDGTNASPYISVKVLSLRGDPDEPSDGLPGYWMQYYFGHTDPRAGDNSRASDDADGDGLNNLQEFIAGMNPTNGTSAQQILTLTNGTLQWQAKAYEVYEILGSTDFTNWTRVVNPVVPTTTSVSIRTTLPDTAITATVSNLPTNGTRMFYRVEKVP